MCVGHQYKEHLLWWEKPQCESFLKEQGAFPWIMVQPCTLGSAWILLSPCLGKLIFSLLLSSKCRLSWAMSIISTKSHQGQLPTESAWSTLLFLVTCLLSVRMKICQFRIDNVFEMRHIKSGYYVNKNERVLKINILTYLISNIYLIS